MAGIYIHIPFCHKACHYCDFHFSTNFQKVPEIVSSIQQEISQRAIELADVEISSVYFGGGTPSAIHPISINDILSKIHSLFRVSSEAEITLEANPDDIDSTRLQHWIDSGINRISLGVQSFFDEDLEWMNRNHTSNQTSNAIELIRNSSIQSYSIDLIYGLAEPFSKSREKNLEKLIEIKPPHLSSYILALENKTAFYHQVQKGSWQMLDDELVQKQYSNLISVAKELGYNHYEVSNFAQPNHIAKHNSSYWTSDKYIGVGPAAHSFNGKERRWNISNNNRYIQSLKAGTSYSENEVLSAKDQYNEFVMTRLRTARGINIDSVKDLFGVNLSETFKTELDKHLNSGKIRQKDSTLYIPEDQWLMGDAISSDFFLTDSF